MRIKPDEAKDISIAVRAAAGVLTQVPDNELAHLIGAVIRETTDGIKGVEKRIEQAGSLPSDIVAILMMWGAIAAIVEDLPGGNERRELFEAGRKVGLLVAKKWGEAISETLAARTIKH